MTNPVIPVIVFNGVTIAKPTEMKYINPPPYGIDGRGVERMRYYYEFEFYWNYLTYAEFQSIYRTWEGHENSGTASITLPPHHTSDEYDFRQVTGVYVDQPRVNGPHVQNYFSDIRMKVRKVFVG